MKLLIVDDERYLRITVKECLKKEGYEAVEACNGYEALELLRRGHPEISGCEENISLVIMDLRMPGMDGKETIRIIKEKYSIPVIFLTGDADELTEIQCLELGADDFIAKPFGCRVLVARVKACLRKYHKTEAKVTNIGDLSVNQTTRQVHKGNDEIRLTQKEYELLELLLENRNRLMERGELLDRVWGYSYYGSQRTVDTHIKTLRAKLGDSSKFIRTVRGVGYYVQLD